MAGIRVYARLIAALAVLLAAALPGYYNRRDTFRHWIRKDQAAERPCGHACCRHMRAHPEHWPVNPPNKYLRKASDNELAHFYARHADSETPGAIAGRERVFAELQRRDMAQERREASEERRRQRWASRRHQRTEAVEAAWLAAEDATRGNMLNRRGKEAGVNERTLFTGTEARARKYASEELLNWWESHPRPTEAHFAGHDTRIGYAAVRGPRARMTSEEQAWRDRYERDSVTSWPIETEREAA